LVRPPGGGPGGHDRHWKARGPEVAVVTADEIEDKVFSIVSEQMGINKAEITRQTSFINDLNADSLDIVELVMEFEDNFEMSIPDEEAEKIKTVGQAIDYIAANQGRS
jgi:acyl carrier protein